MSTFDALQISPYIGDKLEGANTTGGVSSGFHSSKNSEKIHESLFSHLDPGSSPPS